MTNTQLEALLAAIIRMEHKGGYMTTEEYWATVALCQEVGAPSFITEYWAGKAVTKRQDE